MSCANGLGFAPMTYETLSKAAAIARRTNHLDSMTRCFEPHCFFKRASEDKIGTASPSDYAAADRAFFHPERASMIS